MFGKSKTPEDISAEGWLSSETYAELVKARHRDFSAVPFTLHDHAKVKAFGSAHGSAVPMHLYIKSQCGICFAGVIDREVQALAKYIEPVTDVTVRLRIIDGYVRAATADFLVLWQTAYNATIGVSLGQRDREWLEDQLAQRIDRVAEAPGVPFNKTPADRVAAKQARAAMVQALLDRTGIEKDRALWVLSSVGIHAGRVAFWSAGELNLPARERIKLAGLLGVSPDQINLES